MADDACRAKPTFSASRFVFFTCIFLIMLPGSAILFFLLADWPYHVQIVSFVCYTAAVILYTFSSNKGMQRFLYSCPFVRGQLNRLILRHICFLVVLFILQMAARQLRPHLSAYWRARSSLDSPFNTSLLILCASLCLTQILTNRSLLSKAHPENDRES